MSYKGEIRGSVAIGTNAFTMDPSYSGYINNLMINFPGDAGVSGIIYLAVYKRDSGGTLTSTVFASYTATSMNNIVYTGSSLYFEPGNILYVVSDIGTTGDLWVQFSDEFSSDETWGAWLTTSVDASSSTSSSSSHSSASSESTSSSSDSSQSSESSQSNSSSSSSSESSQSESSTSSSSVDSSSSSSSESESSTSTEALLSSSSSTSTGISSSSSQSTSSQSQSSDSTSSQP